MTDYSAWERRVDIACLIVFPIGFIVLALLAFFGYSPAYFADTYVMMTEIISAIVVAILPLMRIKGKFRPPYWFVGIVTSVPYVHSVSLFAGLYMYVDYWDFFSHCYSSFVVTMVAFIALLVIDYYTTRLHLGRGGLILGTMILGHGFGNMWEVGEWIVDSIFADSYMSYSVWDTVKDICLGDMCGVMIMTVLATYILCCKDYGKMVENMNLGNYMSRMGRGWDRKTVNGDPGAETDVSYGQRIGKP